MSKEAKEATPVGEAKLFVGDWPTSEGEPVPYAMLLCGAKVVDDGRKHIIFTSPLLTLGFSEGESEEDIKEKVFKSVVKLLQQLKSPGSKQEGD